MPYIGYQRVIVGATVLNVSTLIIPALATHAELQADVQAVRYTMDGATAPATNSGMIFLTTAEPKLFLIEDLKKIRFIRSGSSNGRLNIHYLN